MDKRELEEIMEKLNSLELKVTLSLKTINIGNDFKGFIMEKEGLSEISAQFRKFRDEITEMERVHNGEEKSAID